MKKVAMKVAMWKGKDDCQDWLIDYQKNFTEIKKFALFFYTFPHCHLLH